MITYISDNNEFKIYFTSFLISNADPSGGVFECELATFTCNR